MTNPTFLEAQRRAFEASERRNCPHEILDFGRMRDGSDRYYIVALEHRWQGWLACASQPVEPVPECTRCHCYDKARAFAGNPMERVTFQFTPPNCGACGKPMALSMWNRPGGPPGNGYVCLHCDPAALEVRNE